MLVAAFAVSQTCQKDQVRISEDAAIATAREQVDFRPRRTQIRLLRQGLNAKPTWIVSMSIPKAGEPIDTQEFRELAVVRIDANTGKVVDVRLQR